MRIGQKVVRIPETFYMGDLKGHQAEKRATSGKVAYIHPEGRYHMVEFETPGGIIRECFLGVAD